MIIAFADRPRKAIPPLIRLVRLFILLLAAGAAVLAADADDAEARLRRGSDDLARMRARMQQIGQSLERDKGQQDELRTALEQAERKLAQAQAEVKKLDLEVDAQEARVREAQTSRAAAERRLQAQKDALAAQLRAAYMMGGGQGGDGRAQLLLSQDDPARASRMLIYFDYLNRARQRSIEQIDGEIRQVQQLEAQYQSELQSLRALQDSRKQALAELADDRAGRREAARRLSARIADEAQELSGLQASEKQMQKLLEQLRRALAETPLPSGDQKPFPEMRGKLAWPLRGAILARYGEPKAGGRLQWKGLWIGAAEGTPVRASARGRVAYVGWLSSYGLIVVLEHEKGYFTLYGHNASVSKSAGDTVAAGEVIAAAGNTGGYEQPGVYFEVRKGTDPLDPRDWLAR
jgi:septal ring factor EnvC (AmiA/AmiB activator)